MKGFCTILASVPKGSSNLKQAYELMRHVAETQISVDTPDAFGQDLYVIAAEAAFQVLLLWCWIRSFTRFQ